MGNLALPSFEHSKWKIKKRILFSSFGSERKGVLQTGKVVHLLRDVKMVANCICYICQLLCLSSANTLKISTAQGSNTSLQNRHFTAFSKDKREKRLLCKIDPKLAWIMPTSHFLLPVVWDFKFAHYKTHLLVLSRTGKVAKYHCQHQQHANHH